MFHQSSINTELFTQYPVDRKNFGGLQSNRMLASFLDLLLSYLPQDRKVTYYDKYAQKKMCSSILYTPIRHCSSLILFLQACLAFNVGFYLGSYPHVCGELGTECLYITGKVSKLVPITACSTMTSERLGVWAVLFCKLSENSIDFIMHIILNHEDLKLTPSY